MTNHDGEEEIAKRYRLSRRHVLQGIAGMIAGTAAVGTAKLGGAAVSRAADPAQEDLIGLVNPMQGTNSNYKFSRGNTLPLVALPFGMTHWSPQNTFEDGWFFDPNLHQLQGIRATHQPSPWMGDYGHFTVMAQAGQADLGLKERLSQYRPEDLHVGPDYLSVLFARDGVRLEMAPTERCAIYRFTFPAGGPGRVFIDAQSRVDIDTARGTITGQSQMGSAGSENAACFFYAEFDTPFVSSSEIRNGQPVKSDTTTKPANPGGVFEFGAAPIVTLRMGTSFISMDQARRNLEREIGNRSLEAIRAKAARVWNDTLGVVQVKGGTFAERRTFYSCLYRAHLFPRMFHEHGQNGKPIYYSPFDGKLHTGVMYTDTGLWDGYHTVYPLLSLLQPARFGEMVQGFVNAYKEGGWLPQWPHPGYHGSMGGTHSDVVLTDAITKNIPGFDRETALAAMWKNATVSRLRSSEGRAGITSYLKYGYIPVGSVAAPVSNTLDYVYDDACIAMAAAHLGHPEKQRTLELRARNYQLLYDPAVGFMRSKNANGTWKADFDQYAWGDAYTEGGPWQWSFAVPHDPAGLMSLMGGQQAFVRKLDHMMWQAPTFHPGGYGQEIHEMSEMAAVQFGQYDQGNQPVHQVLAHYVAAGCPSRFQYWSRRVLKNLYSPEGFAGDEDNGEMASWYVLTALGLFPHCPGRPSYVFTAPLFPEAVIQLSHGKSLTIETPAARPNNDYVHSVALNGQLNNRFWISHAELVHGGRLEFRTGERPVVRRIAVGELPPSFSAYTGLSPLTEAVPVEIRIRCGGEEDGEFVGDCFFDGAQAVTLPPITNGSPRSERRGPSKYRIPVPMPAGNGAYKVKLSFLARPVSGTLDVHINRALRLSSFRTNQTDGLEAREFSGVLPDSNGEVVIEFTPSPGSTDAGCAVSAIEILSDQS